MFNLEVLKKKMFSLKNFSLEIFQLNHYDRCSINALLKGKLVMIKNLWKLLLTLCALQDSEIEINAFEIAGENISFLL